MASIVSEYKKETQREHVLNHSDMYIGSVETHEEFAWVYDSVKQKMIHKKVKMNTGLLKIVDEILVNARDEYIRSSVKADRLPVKRIDVEAGLKNGEYVIAIQNDGQGIPVALHPVEKIYVPELIFGNMLTSSNYNKEEEKLVGGTFGVGSKATNIFSKRFTVETKDPSSGQEYKQTWTNNMLKCGKASIKKCASKKGLVRIEFVPDLDRFLGSKEGAGSGGLCADMCELIHTRVIELAAVIGKDVKFTWNGEDIAVRSFEKFVKLFIKDDADFAFEHCGERWEVAAVLTSALFEDESADAGKPEYRHIAFTNGINNRRGGKHVEYVSKHVLESLCETAAKKKIILKPGQLKDHVTFFINAMIVNPAFDSQTKVTLTTPASKFGSVPIFSGKLVTALVKHGILEEAQRIVDAKNAKDSKKTDGSKKRTIRGLPKLEDAALAGTAKSGECTLILTEGDSAATSAIAGLKVVGREKWGVFPLRGKLLNVKDVSIDKFNNNEELTAVKKILGLEKGVKYLKTNNLRYGRIMIMSDQDVDGFHIRGLLMNLFHTEWPELMHTGFLCTLMTPLVKMSRGSEVLCFYSDAELDAWRLQVGEAVAAKYKSKYYKGLGTSTPAEAREWFEKLADIQYEWDAETNNAMDLAFSKKRADDRKEWLQTYDPKRSIKAREEGGKRLVPYTRFVHDELIHFSNADNLRSLPHVMDGLKPSQRKILFACFKRNLRQEIRVAQLAGYVSEHAAYHHGEASLNQTITSMGQIFVGGNNVNLLNPVGQFGSRLMGGKDAASPRYIHTHLERIVDVLYRKEDEPILEHQFEDGDKIEPVTYLPVVPMLAINGSLGIGTGFSTDIPPHNPRQVLDLLRNRLVGEATSLSGEVLNPWWIGFKGTVEKKEEKQWITKGIYEWIDDKCAVRITELPVGVWTKDYKAFLDTMTQETAPAKDTKEKEKEKKKASGASGAGENASQGSDKKRKEKPILKDFEDLYNDVDVNFTLYLEPEYYEEARTYPAEFEKKFHLTSSWKTSNMCCFDTKRKIVKYATVGDIIEEFYGFRITMYESRRQHQIMVKKDQIEEFDAKYRFVQGIVEGRLKIVNEEDEVVLAGLKGLSLPPRSDRANPDTLAAYEYLLRMRVDRMKKSSVLEALKELEAARELLVALESTSAAQIWMGELDEFLAVWEKHEASMLGVLQAKSSIVVKKKLIKKIKV